MKHKKALTFSIFLLPLLLTSCGNPTSSTLSSPTFTQPGSTVNTTPTSKQTDTGVKATTSSTHDEPEDDPDIIKPEDSPWSEEVTEAMVKYLGGNILPYIDIGKDIDIKWNENDSKDNYRSSLVLTGEKFVEANLTDAENLYDGYSWSTMVYDTSFYAKSEKQHLQISVTSNKDLFELRAYYTEPFDPEAVTDWKDEEKTKLKDYFGKYYNIPFVYLGTTNYSVEFNDDTSKVMVVTGGTWNDQVNQVFEDAFAGTTWVVEVDTEDASKENATYTDELSGTTVVATLAKGTGNKATMTVALNEKFSKENQTDWPSDVKTEISNICNGKTLPYVYLGAVHPTIDSTNTNSRKLTLSGGLWDNSIFDDAREAFVTNGGWTEVKETETDKVEADQADDATGDDTDTPLGETKVEFSLGGEHDSYKATLTKEAAKTEGEYYPKLVVTKTENYDPSTITVWTQAIKDGFADKFTDGIDEILPFMYLGTASPYIDTTTYIDDSEMVIYGGAYNEKVVTLFDQVFEEDGWYVVSEMNTYSKDSSRGTYVYRTAVKKFNNLDVTYKVGLFTTGKDENKTTSFEIRKFVNRSLTANTDWTAESKEVVSSILGSDVEIPFFDTGKDADEIKFGSGVLTINNTYAHDDAVSHLVDFYDTFKAAGWDVTLTYRGDFFFTDSYISECYIDKVYATKTFGGEEVFVKAELGRNGKKSGQKTTITAGFEATYDKENAPTDWSDSLKEAMQTNFGSVLPYIYLGTNRPIYTYNETSKTMQIWGGDWGDTQTNPVITEAKQVLIDNGFTINNVTTNATNLNATKISSDGKSLTVKLSKSNLRPLITLTDVEAYYDGTVTDWSTDVKTILKDDLKGETCIPFIYLGTATPYITKNEKVTDELYVQLAGSTWNSEVIDLAKEKLDADTTDGGWHTKIVEGTTQSIQAYKIYSDHSALRLELKKNSATINNVKTPIVLNIYYDKVDSTATVKTWNDLTDATATKDSNKLSTVMASVFDNKTIPEFLLLKDGLKLPNVSSTTTETSNKCVRFNLYNVEFAPSNLYRIADTLENAGYEIDLDAFGHGAYPSIVAHIKNTDGSQFYIHISTNSSSYPSATATKPTQPGYDVKIIYLPSYSKYSSITEWNDKTKGYMETKFGFVLPYFNIGVSKTGYVTLYSSPSATTATSDRIYFTGYNYDADEFSKITTILAADGWSTSMSYEIPSSKYYALTKVITATKTIGDDAFVFTAKPNLYCKYSSSAIYSVTYSIQRFDSKFII